MALGGILMGAALGLLAGAQPWWRAHGEGLDVSFSGTASTGGLSQALPLVAAAGALLLLTIAARGRRLVAVILVVVGLGMTALGLFRVRPTPEAVQDQVRTVSLIDQFSLSATSWPVVYACAGILIIGAALIIILRSGRWPRSDRYSRSGGATERPLGEQQAEAWAAMDAGIDPTADREPEPARRSDPDVQSGPSRDTMGNTKPSARSQRSAE